MSCCDSIPVSSIPCCRCEGSVFEFTVPNEVWNRIIRQDGPETDREYLCWSCFARAAADRIEECDERLDAISTVLRVIPKLEISQDSGCWNWRGSTITGGYGQVSHHDRLTLVHRLMYMVFVGPIPDGLEIDHLCRNGSCANPAHLEAVTHSENCLRGEVGHRPPLEFCKRGHRMTESNTRINTSGGRVCRECDRVRCRRTRAAEAAKQGART